MIDIDKIRLDTPSCENVLHFNNAGSSLMPTPVFDALQRVLRDENELGGYEAERRAQDDIQAFYAEFASLLNAEPDEIAYIENATRAWDMAFYGLQFNPGDRVITHGSEYASNYLALLQQSRRLGFEIDLVPSDEAVKSLDAFEFKVIPTLNKMLVLELARCEYINRNENIIAVGNSGTGKTHIALGLGLAACQKGLAVGFITASALVHELLEARDEKRLLRLQKQLAKYRLLIIDELGYVPLSPTGAELLFEVFSQRYERGSTIVTSNLPFDEWTSIFGSERLTGALLDRLTHHVHILEMNGESFRLKHSRKRSKD